MQLAIAQFCLKWKILSRERANSINNSCRRSEKYSRSSRLHSFDIAVVLMFINDLNMAVKFCKVHHFAYDTNLLHFSKSNLINQT